MLNIDFLKNAAERAAKTAAQSVLLAIGAAEGLSLFALDWRNIAGAAIGGAVLSLLTSIVSSPLGAVHGSPSLVAPIVAPITPPV
jgi:hypothetical protein